MTRDWFNIPEDVTYVKIRCMPYNLQEPWAQSDAVTRSYLMLKYTDFIPLYDERFVNYGYNKIQYVEHLRLFRVILPIDRL